jgi:hypothetical protein
MVIPVAPTFANTGPKQLDPVHVTSHAQHNAAAIDAEPVHSTKMLDGPPTA